MRISASEIDASLAEIAAVADGRRDVLVGACDLLRARSSSTPRERAIQHMAFSLVSALFRGTAGDERPDAAS